MLYFDVWLTHISPHIQVGLSPTCVVSYWKHVMSKARERKQGDTLQETPRATTAELLLRPSQHVYYVMLCYVMLY